MSKSEIFRMVKYISAALCCLLALFSGLGMLAPGVDPTPISYKAWSGDNHRVLLSVILLSGIIIAILAALTLMFRQLNRRLQLEIAERKAAEEKLRNSEQKYANIFNLMPDMVGITLQADGCFAEVNRGFESCTGWSKEEVIGRSSLELGLWTPETRVRAIGILKQQGLLENFDFILTTKAGAKRQAVMHLVPMTLAGINYLCFLARDVTEQRLMQAELLKNQKLESLGVLAGGIAHDFNNILTSIMGNISLTRLELNQANFTSPSLARAEIAVQRAADLAKRLLVFAKGGQPLKKLVSLQKIVHDALALALSGTKVQSVVDFPAPLYACMADEGQINQAFNNIIINAVHAMPHGGNLTVHGENVILNRDNNLGLPAGTYVKLSFADEGCGVPEGDLMKIFDPYFTTKAGGTGLGLASTHSIISRHGGMIQVNSTDCKGTTFTILLPSRGETYREPRPEDTAPNVNQGGGTILVMDDDEMIRELAIITLQRFGYTVTACINGNEAVALYHSASVAGNPFDLVILDLTIPGGMGGIDTARQIRAFDPAAQLIVSSGYSDDPVMANHADYGFCAAIEKPYNVKDIAAILRRVQQGTVGQPGTIGTRGNT